MWMEAAIIKAAGAVAGTILALVFIPPRTLWGFFRRATASLICGPIFAPIVKSYLAWPAEWEYILASAALAAFISWFVLGVIVSAAKRIIGNKLADDKETG